MGWKALPCSIPSSFPPSPSPLCAGGGVALGRIVHPPTAKGFIFSVRRPPPLPAFLAVSCFLLPNVPALRPVLWVATWPEASRPGKTRARGLALGRDGLLVGSISWDIEIRSRLSGLVLLPFSGHADATPVPWAATWPETISCVL